MEPISREDNVVGFCNHCQNELRSLSYYRLEEEWMVAASCHQCQRTVLMQFDNRWNWKGESDLEMVDGTSPVRVASIPREQLQAVFTSAEIRDMLACEQGQPFTRQNIYRARAKYAKFERLFGYKIKV